MKQIEENRKLTASATYAKSGMAYVSELAYDISKSDMDRMHILLRVTPGNPGILKSMALDMQYAADPESCIYSIWNKRLHEALDFLPRFDSSYALNDPERYSLELMDMVKDVMFSSSYTGTIRQEVIDDAGINSYGSLYDLWFALHDEIFSQAEMLIDSAASMGHNIEYARSQLYVRQMLEKDEDVLAKHLVDYYVDSLDHMTSAYNLRKQDICAFADGLDECYDEFNSSFKGLSGLFEKYNEALRVMECTAFAKWITDEKKMPLDMSVYHAFTEMDMSLDQLKKSIDTSMNELKTELPLTSKTVVYGDTYTDNEIDRMFHQFENAYDMLEGLEDCRMHLVDDVCYCCIGCEP